MTTQIARMGNCCCPPKGECRGVPTSPTCLFSGVLESVEQLAFIFDLDFRMSDVILPAVSPDYYGNGGEYVSITAAEAAAFPYGGRWNRNTYDPSVASIIRYYYPPIRVVIRGISCCNEGTGHSAYVNFATGKIHTFDSGTSFYYNLSAQVGSYIYVGVEVYPCDPLQPMPQAGIPNMNDYLKSGTCDRRCEGGDLTDTIPLSPIETFISAYQRKIGRKSDCGYRQLWSAGSSSLGTCDPDRWLIGGAVGATLTGDRTQPAITKNCFLAEGGGASEVGTTSGEFDTSGYIAGAWARCGDPPTATGKWTARSVDLPFYIGATVSNPVLVDEGSVYRSGGRWVAQYPIYEASVVMVPRDFDIPIDLTALTNSETIGTSQIILGVGTWLLSGGVSALPIWTGAGKGSEEIILESSSVSGGPSGTFRGKLSIANGCATIIPTAAMLQNIIQPYTVWLQVKRKGTWTHINDMIGYLFIDEEGQLCGGEGGRYWDTYEQAVQDLADVSSGATGALNELIGMTPQQVGEAVMRPSLDGADGTGYDQPFLYTCNSHNSYIRLNATALF